MTTFSQQEAELLHKLASNTLSPFEGIALLVFFIPFIPTEWKLHAYLFLTSAKLPIGSTGHLSNTTLTLIFILVPFISVALIFFSILILRSLIPILPDVFQRLIPKRFMPQENKVFLELTFPSDTSKSAYATEQLYTLIHALSRRNQGFFAQTRSYALEIVSTKENGIRYILVVPSADLHMMHRSLLSYLPGLKVKEIPDYLIQNNLFTNDSSTPKNEESETEAASKICSVIELKLSQDFALPLQNQKVLNEHDPISFLTGNMTKLKKGELIAFQVIATPSLSVKIKRRMQIVKNTIYQGKPVSPVLGKKGIPFPPLLIFLLSPLVWLVVFVLRLAIHLPHLVLNPNGPHSKAYFNSTQKVPLQELLNPYEQELTTVVKEKLNQHLFKTSIRLFIVAQDQDEFDTREASLVSSFEQFSSPYQSLTAESGLPILSSFKRRFDKFRKRTLSQSTSQNVLSTSEMSDLYHFPYMDTTKTEDIVKVHSKELPAPLTLKNERNLDAIFGQNTYGGTITDIGVTDEDRSRHMYLLGQTGSGKTTVIFHMAKEDIQKGRGLAVIDPHGDLAEDLLTTVPKERINDLIYLNPFDLKYPVGINLLELTPGLDDDDLELEKELVAESVISIFRRVFSKDEQVDAHRIEYILRNTIYTVFTTENPTLFTIYDILNNPDFRRKAVKNLEDENLRNFWKYEFGRAGDYQVVKMVGGVTAKVGRFLFSPTARRILEQKKSTINFSDILDNGKILICNLSEGKLGEDTMQLLGTTIITKIQQAALRRSRVNASKRTPFYLFVDEFQNFATASFNRMLSGGRKFGLRLTIAEQSTSQQSDRSVVNVILANTGTVICFRTASPVDEELMLAQFSPYIKEGEIANLPRFHFYIKLSAVNPEEPFSGETLPIEIERDQGKIEKLIAASRKNWTIEYKKPIQEKKATEKDVKQTKTKIEPPKKDQNQTKDIKAKRFVPDEVD